MPRLEDLALPLLSMTTATPMKKLASITLMQRHAMLVKFVDTVFV
jgi:hypothetical protein